MFFVFSSSVFLPFCFRFSFFSNFVEYFCGIVIVCLLVDSGVVVVLAASCCNVTTACSMCSGVFNGMLQFILLSIISLKVCHLVILLHSVSGLL